jgi:hypothetical protein
MVQKTKKNILNIWRLAWTIYKDQHKTKWRTVWLYGGGPYGLLPVLRLAKDGLKRVEPLLIEAELLHVSLCLGLMCSFR